MSELDGLGNHALGQLAGPKLDHGDGLEMAGDHEIEVRVLELGDRGVDDELAVYASHARAGKRPVERDGRDRERRRRGHQPDHVGIVLQVGGQDHDLDLDLVLKAVRKQRAHRAVDQPAGQDLLEGRATFALEKAAGELAGSGHFLAIINGQREEIHADTRIGGDHRAEHDGIAVADDRGSRRLPRHLPNLDRQYVSPKGAFHLQSHLCLLSFLSVPGRTTALRGLPGPIPGLRPVPRGL